jgi:hypothetical protein
MLFKSMIGSIALATAVLAGPAAAQQSFDASKELARSASSTRPNRPGAGSRRR